MSDKKVVEDISDEYLKQWLECKIVKYKVYARQLRVCEDDVNGLPWWLFFLQWPVFLYIGQKFYEHFFSREFLARFVHVDMVVIVEKGECVLELNIGRTHDKDYIRPVGENHVRRRNGEISTEDFSRRHDKEYTKLIGENPNVLNINTIKIDKDQQITLLDLLNFKGQIKGPYHVVHNNCIRFTWTICKDCFGQKNIDNYYKFRDSVAYDFMCTEDKLCKK